MLLFIVVVLLLASDVSICFQWPPRFPSAISPPFLAPFPPSLPSRSDYHQNKESYGSTSYIQTGDAIGMDQIPSDLRTSSPVLVWVGQTNAQVPWGYNQDRHVYPSWYPTWNTYPAYPAPLPNQDRTYGPVINALLIVPTVDVRTQYVVDNGCRCCNQQQSNLPGRYAAVFPLIFAPNKEPSSPSTSTNRPTTTPTITTTDPSTTTERQTVPPS